MLPDFLRSTYKTYKRDTDIIATWLAITAKRCGYSKDLLTNHNTIKHDSGSQKTGKRLKGKARKLAKAEVVASQESEKKENHDNGADGRPIYTIDAKDFISLAQFIAGKPRLKVPAVIAESLSRSITLRREHGSFRQAQGHEPLSDQAHAHFLGILEHVAEILRPYNPSTPTSTEPHDDSTRIDQHAQLNNMFDKLDVQEVSDSFQAFLDAPDVEQAVKTEVEQGPVYETKRMQDRLEEYTAAHSFFQDIFYLNHFVKQAWALMKQGGDLAAAAVTVNTLITFVRDLEEGFQDQFPEKIDYEDKAACFYLTQCRCQGIDQDFLHDNKAYEFAEDTLRTTYCLVLGLQTDGPAEILSSHADPDRSAPEPHRSPEEKFKDNQWRLREVYPNLDILSGYIKNITMPEDELIRGVREMKAGKPIPVWLVFAFKCFLDAQHILGEALDGPFLHLKELCATVRESIMSLKEFHKSLSLDYWRNQEGQLNEILDIIKDWISEDKGITELRSIMKSAGLPPTLSPFTLQARHPLLCGLCAFALRLHTQEVAIKFVNTAGSIISVAHLHNAVAQYPGLTSHWIDMQLLVSLQTPNVLFVGQPPDLKDCLRRFELSLGASAVSYARDRRANARTTPKSPKGPKGLEQLARVSRLCGDRYCNNAPSVSWTKESIKEIMDSIITLENPKGAEMFGTILVDKEAGKNGTKKPMPGLGLIKPKRMEKLMPIHDFMETFYSILQNETQELSFDYLLMHRICWRLLQDINKLCRPELTRLHGAGYLPQEHHLVMLPLYIFKPLQNTDEGFRLSRPLLNAVADAFEETIKNCGEKIIHRSHQLGRGF